MAKLLLVIAVTVLVVLLFKSMSRKSGAAKPPQTKGPEDMVRCEVCGVNLPRSEALMSRGRFYCSDQHRLQDSSRR